MKTFSTALPRAKQTSVTQLRVRLYIPAHYQQEPVLSRLISNYGLVVNITGAVLENNTHKDGCFDLELRGSFEQIKRGLGYLDSLHIQVIGKPNPAGDSWNY